MRTALCLFLSLVCANSVAAFEDDAEKVKRLIADIKAKGEPVSAKEMRTAVPLAAGVEDVTHLWMEGFALINTPEYVKAKGTLAFVGVPKKGFEPIVGQPWPTLDRAARFLEKHQDALRLFHEAARRRGQSRFPAWEVNSLYPRLDWHKQAGEAIKLLQLEFEVRTRQKDSRGAARSLLTMLSLVHTDELHLHLGDLRLEHGREIIEQIRRGDWSDDELKSLQFVLRSYSFKRSVRNFLLSNRAVTIDWFREMEKGISKLDEEGRKKFYARYSLRLESMKRMLLVVEEPSEKRLAELKTIFDETMQAAQKSAMPDNSFFDLGTLGGLQSPLQANLDAINLVGHFQYADIWIAVELYRRANGKLPESFEMLVPMYLTAIPVGPDGKTPLSLKASEKGFTIYNRGVNQRDEEIFFPLK